MNETTNNSDRIDKLELKIMDLEMTLQQLNEVVVNQYRDIERLRQHHGRLEQRLESIQADGPAPSPRDELPPHY